jgi:uncharacterized membrane protein YfcA
VLAAVLGCFVGSLAGLLGAGGGFLIVPFAFVGKLISGQVHADLAAALVLGASPCAYLGTHIGRRLPPRVLRLLLGIALVGIAVRGAYVIAFS